MGEHTGLDAGEEIGLARQLGDGRGPLLGQGRTAEMYAWSDDQALKLYHAGWPATSVEHEAQLSRVVAATEVPAPAVGEVLAIDGRYGILFERLVCPSKYPG